MAKKSRVDRYDYSSPKAELHERSVNVGGVYPGVYSRRGAQGTPTEYGVDVQGLPISGNGWGEVNTPIGTFRGGLSDDGVAGASYAPPVMSYESNPYYQGAYIDNGSGVYPGVYRQQVGDQTRYGAEIQGLPYGGNGWGQLNTPLGTFRGGLSDDNVAGVEY